MSNNTDFLFQSVVDKMVLASENIPKVFSSGKTVGFREGKEEEWSIFWDAFQDGGERRIYKDAFSRCWNAANFKPKYDIIAQEDASGMFRNWGKDLYGNIAEICRNCGVTLDLSNATCLSSAFEFCCSPELPTLDLSNAVDISDMLSFAGVKRIEKIISSGITGWQSPNALSLWSQGEHCIFEGEICESITLSESAMFDKETIVSMINTLSQNATGMVATVGKKAVDKAFETSEGANDGSESAEWMTLTATKTNWTISLS